MKSPQLFELHHEATEAVRQELVRGLTDLSETSGAQVSPCSA